MDTRATLPLHDLPTHDHEGPSPSPHHDRNRERPRPGDTRSAARHNKGHGHGPMRHRTGSEPRCVALIDARFWWWLQDEDDSDNRAAGPLPPAEELADLVAQHSPGHLLRTYWYTDDARSASAPGLVVRRVLADGQDGGVSLLRALAQDLMGLAQAHGADRVLLVSDDERLLLAVDEAQRAGLQVDMLVDEAAGDLQALREDDPSWARLLATADRLVVLGRAPVRASAGRGRGMAHGDVRGGRDRRDEPSAEAAQLIETEVQAWWSDESDSQRAHWREEAQGSRGIPQDLDRQLLLRISRCMDRPLSPGEKSAMRREVRHHLLGEARAAGATASAEHPAAVESAAG